MTGPGRQSGLAASAGKWSVRQLQAAIRENAYEQEVGKLFAVPLYDDPVGDKPLRARFGQLNTYRVVASGDPDDDSLFLDLGFNVTTRLLSEEATGLQTDQLVQITESAEGRSIVPCPNNARRYTYRAWVQRVVDGDTLIVIVDLGLGHQTRPVRLRLRGIDCPELSTLAGRTARDFVREALAPAKFVIITTHRTDTYGRYLADVRYLADSGDPETVLTEGVYLNRQLLEEHMAKRYSR